VELLPSTPSFRHSLARTAFFSAEFEAVFRKEKCATKENVALAPTHPCAGNNKELPKNLDKYMIKNYSIQQSIDFLTNSPSFSINPFFSVSFLFIALSSIFFNITNIEQFHVKGPKTANKDIVSLAKKIVYFLFFIHP
jgi:hypothetical protein